MARYDKYEPYAGGFRALLAADWLEADLETVIGVGLDSSGRVVKGSGQSGVVGVLVLTKARKAGEVVDVMTDGEIVDMNRRGPRSAPVAVTANPGVIWHAAANGAVAPRAADVVNNGARVGHSVEGTRLVVRVVPEGTFA